MNLSEMNFSKSYPPLYPTYCDPNHYPNKIKILFLIGNITMSIYYIVTIKPIRDTYKEAIAIAMLFFLWTAFFGMFTWGDFN